MRNSWSHSHVWQIKLRRGILAAEVPRGARGPSPTPASPAGAPVPGRGALAASGCENQRGFRLGETEAAVDPGISVKGLHRDSDSLPGAPLGSGVGMAPQEGEAESCGSRARAGGQHRRPVWSPPPVQRQESAIVTTVSPTPLSQI